MARAIMIALAFLYVTGARAEGPVRDLQQYKHHAWTFEDGAPQNVNAIAQTTDGFLWLGASTGLYRFDGVRFEKIDIGGDGSTQDQFVTALYGARDGTLWIGGRTGRIAMLRDGHVTDSGLGIRDGSVGGIAGDADGGVWFSTGSPGAMVLHYHAGTWTRTGPPPHGPNQFRGAPLAARDGTIWLVAEGGVFFLPADAPSRKTQDRETPSQGDGPQGQAEWQAMPQPVPGNGELVEDGDGRVWLFSDRGMVRLPDYPRLPRPWPPAEPLPKTHEYGYGLLADKDGDLWGVSIGKGLFRIRRSVAAAATDLQPVPEGDIERYALAQGLTSNVALSLFQDREGNIWVGTSAGLDRFRPADVIPDFHIGRESTMGYLLAAAGDGTVYAGDADTVYRIAPGGTPEAILHDVANPQAMCEAADHSIWLGTHAGVFRYADGRFAPAPVDPGPYNYFDCVTDGQGALWFSTIRKGLLRYQDGQWTRLGDYVSGLDAVNMVADHQGRIVVSTYHDLRRIDPSGDTVLWKQSDALGGQIYLLYRGATDVLVATTGGLVRLRGDSTQYLAGYPWLRSLTGIVQTPDGETWLQGNSQIARVATADLDAAFDHPGTPLHPFMLDALDGLAPLVGTYPQNSLVRGGDGRLWFMTGAGIMVIDPHHLTYNALPPPVVITRLAADGRRYNPHEAATLPKGTTGVQVDFTATSLSVPERVRFRYRLEGVDTRWVEAGDRREAFYTNLGPGDYRFRVIAANNDGVWNESGAVASFTILPLFWQTRPFIAACVVLGLLALWGLYRLRLRQVAARIRGRIDAQVAERERIARELHDTLLQGVQGLILRFQAIANRLAPDQAERALMLKALDQADEVLVEGRDRVLSLRRHAAPEPLEAVLAGLVEHLFPQAPPLVGLRVDGVPRPLDRIVEEEVERIAREALANIAHHADAATVDITIHYGARRLELVFRDDGRGIDAGLLAHGRDGHFGLAGMRERAARIGGRLDISSAPASGPGPGSAAGTIVRIGVPASLAYAGPRRPAWLRGLSRLFAEP
ncbi:MAG: two-component regulator propeller domain-containing protein [Azospirillaceae bacterium]|nr:two-component regulator propeller domain-containing protein [Azospirillaceae bacterium]